MPVDGGDEREVFRFAGRIAGPAFEANQQGIYFVTGDSATKPGEMMFYRFSDGSFTKVASVESPSFYGLSLSPDGRWMLYTKFTSTGSDLMLVENFR